MMKTIVLFCAALLAAAALRAQPDARQQIDSLERVIRNATDDGKKAESYCDLCWQLLIDGQIEAALEKGEAGAQLARKIGDRQREAICQNNMGSVYWNTNDYARALDYYKEGAAIFKAIGDRRNLANVQNNIGLIYDELGDYARALNYYETSLETYISIKKTGSVPTVLNNIGGIYETKGDYARALNFYQKSLKMSEEQGDLSSAATASGNIGLIYRTQGNYAKALEFFQQCLKSFEALGERRSVAIAFGNIGLVYEEFGNMERALEYHKKSLTISEEIGFLHGRSIALSNIGGYYENDKNYVRALAYYQKSRKICDEVGNLDGFATSCNNIANIHIITMRPEVGAAEATRALEIAEKIGAMESMQVAAKTLTKADSALGDWKSAYEHYKLYKQYSDSLRNDEQSKEIGRLEAQYDFDKEIEERERREAEAAARRATIMWVAVGAFAALALVAGLLTWGFQTKKKANKQLTAQNEEIRAQSEEIKNQRDELQTLNERISEQHARLEKAHHEITDSVEYASRIQHALLPSDEMMRQNADVYVYYNARDVVSGDFYWTHRIDDDTALYTAADCTGHGVPGAFMSVLGATTLDTIVREYGETRPDEILGRLDLGIRNALKQDENKDGSLDGMDLALIKLDRKNRKLQFSSAGRPLFLLRNGEVQEYKGAKFPAGGAQHGEKTFPLIEIDLEPGDRLFMCSDGVTDQFGGPRKRKFSPRRLKETLVAHQEKSLQAQGAAFAEIFNEWQANAKQLDDQLLIGLEA